MSSFNCSKRDLDKVVEYLSGYKKADSPAKPLTHSSNGSLQDASNMKTPDTKLKGNKFNSLSHTGRCTIFDESNALSRSNSREIEYSERVAEKYNITSKISQFKQRNSFCQNSTRPR